MSTTYRQHQTKSLEAEASAQLPQLQHLARREDKKDKILDEIRDLRVEIRRLQMKLSSKQTQYYRLVSNDDMGGEEEEDEMSRSSLTFPCPKHDCKGTLNTNGKCMLCDTKFCKKCHVEEEEEEHECKEDDVQNVRLLRQNTKLCPKCRHGIFKTEGCDQMWCTACHTCFSWSTGRILNGTVHNPHFYEYMRNNRGNAPQPRNVGDVPCGGLPSIWEIQNIIYDEPSVETVNHILLHHEMLNHIIGPVMHDVHHKMNQRTNKSRDYGVAYLRKKIDRSKWVQMLFRLHKQEESNQRLYELLETFTFNGAELYRQYCQHHLTGDQLIHNIGVLMECYNSGVSEINYHYNKKHTHLSLNMNIRTIR